MKELLDGKLSPEEIADDPVLASLAERIYGSEFLEDVGISRGSTKRALAEQFSDIDGEDLLIEVIPDEGVPLPMPGDMPPVPTATFDLEEGDEEGRSLLGMVQIGAGFTGLITVIVNLFYGLGNFVATCPKVSHDTCGVSMKLNWMDFFRMDEYIAWSESGSIGIPDIGLAILCMALMWKGIRK
ncbi:MAG: hypothetical protein QF440_01280 [Candidatus Thalassarchaeaceae archaeon]|nr:hypothetical protein [Candidatus Thalassarchaeaceae archaeon]